MADNSTLPAEGDVIAADEIGGVKHQRVKIQHGADGSATDISNASPLPISDAGGSITVDGTVGVSGTVPVSDGSGSLTVDAPLGTPVGVRLSDGSGALATTSSELHIRDATARSTLASILSALGNLTSDPATETTLTAILAALGGSIAVDDDQTQSALATIAGHVDGLESALSTLAGHVDGLEGQITTLNGYVDGLEALLGSGKTLQFAEIDRASSGAIVAAAGSGVKIYVVSYSVVCSTANTVEWRSASTGISGAMSFAANGGIAERGSLTEPLMATAGNEALNIQLGSAQQVSGRISYYTGA